MQIVDFGIQFSAVEHPHQWAIGKLRIKEGVNQDFPPMERQYSTLS